MKWDGAYLAKLLWWVIYCTVHMFWWYIRSLADEKYEYARLVSADSPHISFKCLLKIYLTDFLNLCVMKT